MSMVSFADRSFRVAPVAGGASEVVLTSLVSAADARALATAVGWWRSKEHLAPAIESAEGVMALRATMSLVDLLDEVGESAPGMPVDLQGPQLRLLAEAVTTYVADRDADEGYSPPEQRDRLKRLRTIGDRLFDAVADFAGAEAEARELGRSA
jgi:hypothetical protein